MKKLFIISALIIASLCSCIKGSELVILAAEEAEYNKCREIFPEIECIRTGVGAGNVIKACCNLFHLTKRQIGQFVEIYEREYYGDKWGSRELRQKIKFAIIMRIADILVRKFN